MPHETFTSCIEACSDCATACDHCAISCLSEPNPKAMAHCIALDIDCAEMCRLAAGYMSRGSEQAALICGTCAEVCEACATECDKHDAEHCKSCARECRRCAEECRNIAGGGEPRKAAQPKHARH